MSSVTDITSLLQESRRFEPDPLFRASAHLSDLAAYREMVERARENPEAYWADHAAREIQWMQPWEQVLDWQAPHARWFVGGRLNVSSNCLDRHLEGPRRHKAALVWEGEPGDQRTLTYQQLHREVCRFAGALLGLGVQLGDRVAIYMPMIPEAVVAMLACARIGAIHSVVFGGFSSESLKDRLLDAGAKVVVTADGGYRRGSVFPLKPQVDQAVASAPCVENVVVVRRGGNDVEMTPGRDHWYHDLTAASREDVQPVAVDSEHPLFILYTSGTTGKPKGIVHTSAGYLLGATLTSRWVFDLHDTDLYWCTADIGWITGHSYVVYGPLSNGATIFMYEGAPATPAPDRFWDMIDRHGISILYTAPTAIRSFIRSGDAWPLRHPMSRLRVLGTVGEPINPEAWMWYRSVIGRDRCPIVDTWWQTETGSIMVAPLPGLTTTKPGTATLPLPGIDVEVVDRDGRPVEAGQGGLLVIRKPWPSMLRGIWGDPERYTKTYWSEIPGVYFTGDGARRDEDGYFWIMGRVDDVINVSGHRLGTMEIESALVSHPAVAEAAVVGRPDELKGTAVCAFVTVQAGVAVDDMLRTELRAHVVKEIGALARPEDIRFTESLPKTRSGKIMRRLLRDIAAGREAAGDTSTLEDYSVLARLRVDQD